MAIEVGMILEGKVSGITKFGAFVDLPDSQTGMVHISEVAHTYINEIGDYVKVGQTVKVKVLALNNGKISLSMKQIAVEVICGDYDLKKTEEVTGEKDWHKNKDKTTHPYRTYYKNVLPSPAVPHILQEEELPRKRWILHPLPSVW